MRDRCAADEKLALFCFFLSGEKLFCFALFCFALPCFVLLCFALLCFALLCFVLFFSLNANVFMNMNCFDHLFSKDKSSTISYNHVGIICKSCFSTNK